MRAIDADALQKKLTKKKPGPANARYTEGFNDALLRFKSMIHTAPTIEPDPDTISRQAVIELIQGSICDLEYSDENRELCNKVRALPPSPSRPKGKWKTIAFLTTECSECHAQIHELEYGNFCPNCGADNREERGAI